MLSHFTISDLDQIQKLDNDDLFIISKYNSNTGKFKSYNIKAQNMQALMKLQVEDFYAVTIYVSPNNHPTNPGSDNNLENQFKYYGTEQQINYPLFTIHAAVRLANRIITTIPTRMINIYCFDGTYRYSDNQCIDTIYNSTLNIQSYSKTTSGEVIFEFCNESGGDKLKTMFLSRSPSTYIHFEDIHFRVDQNSNGHRNVTAIYINHSCNVEIQNCIFENFHTGIASDNPSYFIIKGNNQKIDNLYRNRYGFSGFYNCFYCTSTNSSSTIYYVGNIIIDSQRNDNSSDIYNPVVCNTWNGNSTLYFSSDVWDNTAYGNIHIKIHNDDNRNSVLGLNRLYTAANKIYLNGNDTYAKVYTNDSELLVKFLTGDYGYAQAKFKYINSTTSVNSDFGIPTIYYENGQITQSTGQFPDFDYVKQHYLTDDTQRDQLDSFLSLQPQS